MIESKNVTCYSYIYIDRQLCNYCEPDDRDISMVFQNYALYPNMTVYGNLAYHTYDSRCCNDHYTINFYLYCWSKTTDLN